MIPSIEIRYDEENNRFFVAIRVSAGSWATWQDPEDETWLEPSWTYG